MADDTEQSVPAKVITTVYNRLIAPAVGLPPSQSPNGSPWPKYQVVPLPSTSYPAGTTNPNSPPAGTKFAIEDSNATKTARAKDVAKHLCKQKNRKFRKQHITIAFNPAVESGTTYTLQGWSPYLDGAWLVTQVIHNFGAKGGTTTEIDLQKAVTEY